MKFRLGTWAVATASSFLSVALIGCNPPVDEAKKADAPPATTSGPAPADSSKMPPAAAPTDASATPAPAPAPAPTPPADPPKVDEAKPVDAPKELPKS